ncbi:hypothetical protein Afil01_40170 [Actinorhabdospora filicis]|uniref:Uncharacterized protein n=1 Tax=Actinorhabdospora filicis TaxID=1785913 RepID=A0A9W6SLM2_9ACTN|nr:hypothetical protein Afil01_40170 [Actinorhabdospora filicis]
MPRNRMKDTALGMVQIRQGGASCSVPVTPLLPRSCAWIRVILPSVAGRFRRAAAHGECRI